MSVGLFPRLLGPAFDALPTAVARAHGGCAPVLRGVAEVRRSRHPIAWAACELMRLPRSGRAVPVTIAFTPDGEGERWTRDFAGRGYASRLRADGGLLAERLRPATILFRLHASAGALRHELVGFRLFGIPLPRWARPRCIATERDEDGAFAFDIPIDLPGLGRVIRYTGRLRPSEETRA